MFFFSLAVVTASDVRGCGVTGGGSSFSLSLSLCAPRAASLSDLRCACSPLLRPCCGVCAGLCGVSVD